MTTDSRRQITDAGGMIEIIPAKTREISDVAVSVEIAYGHYRQITDVALVVEFVPCIERLGDYGYAEKQFYLEKLRYLNENYGKQVDLTPYEGCISVDQLESLKQLYIGEVLNTDVMAPIAFLLRPLVGMTALALWDVFTRLRDGCRANPGLACIVEQGIAELDPLLRDYFTAEIRQRVGSTFRATSVTARLFEIYEQLRSCSQGDHLCMVRLGIPEIEDALMTTVIAAIRNITDARDGGRAKFDERGIALSRLAEIYDAIRWHTAESLANWKFFGECPEIEEVIRDRRIERTFGLLWEKLHGGGDPQVAIATLLDDYRGAIEVAFSVTFEVQDPNDMEDVDDAEAVQTVQASYAWGLGVIHFARLGLDAIATAFENWVQSQPGGQRWVNRFRVFRNIMGSMTFRHVHILASNVAKSEGHRIKVYQRPVLIAYYVYKVNGVWTYVLQSAGEPDGYAAGDGYISMLPQYIGGTYGVGPMVPAERQAVMTPNNLIHELGHSLSAFGGFGKVMLGSLEYALLVAGMPSDRDGMGKPPYAANQLFYQHAAVKPDPERAGFAVFVPLSGEEDRTFHPSSYLVYDLFGDRYSLWDSDYNPFTPFRMAARVDVFVHNWAPTPTETAADAFLNWVRNAFNEAEPFKWRTFFEENIAIVLRNAAFYQKAYQKESGIIPFYKNRQVIADYHVGSVAGKGEYNLRVTPEVPAVGEPSNIIAKISAVLGPEGSVSIYGKHDPTNAIDDGSPYWLLVSTKSGELTESGNLAWIASNGVSIDLRDTLTSIKTVDPADLSPARPFDIEDLAILL